tara:strand:- start:2462 stop:3571 length:1110 start_codon:yes stop_codon:yes gene_type:complete
MTTEVVDTKTGEIIPVGDTPLAVPSMSPEKKLQLGNEAATALMAAIQKSKKKPKKIGDSEHLFVEHWITIGAFFSCSAGPAKVEPVEMHGVKGFKAEAEVFDDRTGHVLGHGIAYCMRDESKWRNRETFQLASMAMTRATSKALSMKFRWVAVLAGFAPTPEEEMPREGATLDDRGDETPKPTEPIEWTGMIAKFNAQVYKSDDGKRVKHEAILENGWSVGIWSHSTAEAAQAAHQGQYPVRMFIEPKKGGQYLDCSDIAVAKPEAETAPDEEKPPEDPTQQPAETNWEDIRACRFAIYNAYMTMFPDMTKTEMGSCVEAFLKSQTKNGTLEELSPTQRKMFVENILKGLYGPMADGPHQALGEEDIPF